MEARVESGVDWTRLALHAALFAFLLIVTRVAWVCDDAYITFRTVKNFVAGDGLTWNIAERVQAYTNPLWMFVVSALFVVTGDVFYTSIALSIAATAAAVWIVARRVAPGSGGLVAIAALTASKAFTDYSTSGLENPLLHLLLAVALWVHLVRPRDARTLLYLSLLAALLATTRLDTVLLVLPLVAHEAWRERRARPYWRLAAGFAPLLAWELFSIVYYGFPFPNTAYAKLGAGVGAGQLAIQGLYYYVAAINADPVTLVLLFSGIVAALLARRRELLLPVAGVVLYLLYVVRIGGDFMLGRFFAAPLLVSVAVLARTLPLALGPAAATAAAILAFGHVTTRLPTLASDAAYDNLQFSRYHVSDERWYYWKTNGFLSAFRGRMPTHGWAEEGKKIKPDAVVPAAGGGMKGFFAPRTAFLVDNAALSEPLLARLPAIEKSDWLIGHLRRPLPDGYIDTLRSGTNRLRDRDLARYYDELALVTRGPLFSAARWGAIWRLNTGALDHLIDVPRYQEGVVRRAPAEIAGPSEEGGRWDAPGSVILVADMTLEVPVGATHAPAIEVVADANDTYDLELRSGDQVVGRVLVPTVDRGGLRRRVVRVPPDVAQRGYDVVRIGPREGDGMFSVAELRLARI